MDIPATDAFTLSKLLKHPIRIDLVDGRTLVGLFVCTDNQPNIVLTNTKEYWLNSEGKLNSAGDYRDIGCAMVPGRHVKTLVLTVVTHIQLVGMPTVILLDASLSMLASNKKEDGGNSSSNNSRLNMARIGITHFIQLLQDTTTKNHQLIQLVSFTHETQLLCPYTRDYATIISACTKVEAESRTDISCALRYASDECGHVWSTGVNCQVILITDGCSAESSEETSDFSAFLPLPGPSIIQIVCLTSSLSESRRQFFESILKQNNQSSSEVHYLSPVSNTALSQRPHDTQLVKELFSNIVQRCYSPTYTLLVCGSLSAPVQLSPPSLSVTRRRDDDSVVGGDAEATPDRIGDKLHVLGFISLAELANPPVVAKHLLLALPKNQQQTVSKEEERIPSLCVLLHGSMKCNAGTVALTQLGADWFGAIFHIQSETKKSNLVLHCFEPGASSVPWLGKLTSLTPRAYDGGSVETTSKGPFPLALRPKPSYAANQTNWIEPYGLQSDIQKVLRYAKKLPDRHTQFYQEVSRVCTHCMAVGFAALQDKLATLLEKFSQEPSANQYQRKHCSYVAQQIRSGNVKFGELMKPPV